MEFIKKKLEELGFRYLKTEDKELFDNYYKKMEKSWASTISFASMIAWNHSTKIYYKVIYSFLVCFSWNSKRKEWELLPFLGEYKEEEVIKTFEEVYAMLEQLQLPFIMIDVSEWMKPFYEGIPNINIESVNDISLADYIYQVDDFKESLDSQKTRYDYRYFIRKYNPELELMIKEHKEEYIAFLIQCWCTEHTCEECFYGCLKYTLSRVCDMLSYKEIKGIVIRIEGKIVAYSIVVCENGQGIYLFKKTMRGYRGINEYLHKECFDRFLQDAKIINYTEDMGLAGLRTYKQKLAPYTLAPKYELKIEKRR